MLEDMLADVNPSTG